MSPIASSTNPAATLAPTSKSAAVDRNMFLQLLVTQLKNQDPLNPSNSSEFVTQLAQFQQLEQSVNTGQDITAIRKDADQFAITTGATSSTKP